MCAKLVSVLSLRYFSSTYAKYQDFLEKSAGIEVDNFLKSSDNDLQQFGKVYKKHTCMHINVW